jgi:large subunit ribosomal protein L18
LNNIRVQIAEYLTDGDKIVASAISSDLKKEGWKYNCANLPAAYLTGMLCGSRAIKAGIKEAVLDIGLNEPINGCKIYAALKGAIDAGLQIPHSSDAFPKEERLNGAHLQNQKADEVAKAIEQIKSKLAGSKKE